MLKKITILLILTLSFLLINPLPINALTLSERIDQYPQWNNKIKLPQPDRDLIFPQWFEGRWKVTSILKEQIAPLAPRFKTPGFEQNQQYLNQEIDFEVRYTSTMELPKQNSFLPAVVNQKSVIIADRAFNGLSIAQAYMGTENVNRVITNPNNSTEQITQFKTDNQLISTVIGRQQQTVSAQEFITSEITRQFFRRSDSVYLNIVESTTKYNLINPNLLEAQQISAIYLSPKDPDYFLAIDQPVALYNYSLKLTKINNYQ